MESIFMDVNWTAVIVGAVAAYLAGWLWYSKKMFGTKWAAGVGIDINDGSGPMGVAMISQAIGTFLLAWVIGVTETTENLGLAILIAITYAVLVKAKGFFQMNTKYAITVDSSFILVMVIIMILVHAIL